MKKQTLIFNPLLLAILLVVSFAGPIYASTSTDPDLIGLWRMDGDWNDSSVAANHGIAFGGARFSTDSKAGTHAGYFDGSSDWVEAIVDVPETNFTVEFWAKTESGGGIFSVNTGGIPYPAHDRHIYVNNGKPCFRVFSGSTWCSDVTVNDNQWHHWVFVTETGVGQSIYIDGNNVGSFTYDHSDFTWQDKVTLGYSEDGRYFNGFIDELSIYKRAFTSEEANERYSAVASTDILPPQTPLVDPVSSPTVHNVIQLSGEKSPGSSIIVNGETMVPYDNTSSWDVSYNLPGIGVHDLVVTSQYAFGNPSGSAVLTVELVPAKQVDSSIVGLWHMDGDWRDYSGNGLHGTSSRVTFSNDFLIGDQSGDFSKRNDEFLRIGSLYGRFPNNAYTIQGWVKFNEPVTYTGRKTIAGGVYAYGDYGIGIIGKELMTWVYDGSRGHYVKSGIIPAVGEWYHLAGVYDGTRLKLFVNGVPKGDKLAKWSQRSNVQFWIGAEQCCSSNNFNGLIDEVSVYSRPLDLVEIQQAYNAKGGQVPSAPVLDANEKATNNNFFLLSGTKQAGTSVLINDEVQVPADSSSSWQVTVQLHLGVNDFKVSSRSPSGLFSESVPASIELLAANQYDPSIAGLWHLDGDWLDYSGNGNHGSPEGDAQFTSDSIVGPFSGALDGEGDRVNVGNIGFGRDSFTIEAWFKAATFDGRSDGTLVRLISKDNHPTSWWVVDINDADNDGLAVLSFSARDSDNIGMGISSAELISSEVWTHIAITADRETSTIRAYINGDLVKEGSIPESSGHLDVVGRDVLIGANWWNSFNGLVDEVTLYRRALGPEEVQAHYDPINALRPEILLTSSLPAAVTEGILNLSGTKTPGSSIWVNNVKSFGPDNNTDWQANVQLVYGQNQLEVVAIDSRGISSEPVVAEIIYDNLAPGIVGTLPASEQGLVESSDPITFLLADEYSTVDFNASSFGLIANPSSENPLDGTWIKSGDDSIIYTPANPLTVGEYVVSFELVDLLGNKATREYRFTVIPPPHLPGWKNRIPISVDHTRIDQDLSDYPLRVKLGTGSGIDNKDVTRLFDHLSASDSEMSQMYIANSGSDYAIIDFNDIIPAGSDAEVQINFSGIALDASDGGWDDGVSLQFVDLDTTNGFALKIRPHTAAGFSFYNLDNGSLGSPWGTDATRNSTFGSVRIQRIGSTYIFYAKDGDNEWRQYYSLSKPSFEARVRLIIHRNVDFYLDNISITSIENFKGTSTNSFTESFQSYRTDEPFRGETFSVTPALDVQRAEVEDLRGKIALTTADGSSQCFVEIDKWDLATKEAELWAKIPTISADHDTQLYLYYDAEAPDNDQYVGDAGSVAASNVWDDNYLAVYHLTQEPSSSALRIVDSSANAMSGIPYGNLGKESFSEGPSGDALHFDGSSYVRFSSPLMDFSQYQGYTVEVLANRTAPGRGGVLGFNSSTTTRRQPGIWNYPSEKDFHFGHGDGTNWRATTALGSVPSNNWYHLAMDWSADQGAINGFVNGSRVASVAAPEGPASNGIFELGRVDNYHRGLIDEVRLSKSKRPDGWLKAESYNLFDDLCYYDELARPVSDSDLVGLWHMDGDWIDSSGNQNHGVAYNQATFGSDKVVGAQAGSFDGNNDYVVVPDSSSLHSERNITLSGWFKTDGFDREWQSIFWKGNEPDCTNGCENREFALWIHRDGYLELSSTPGDRIGVGNLTVHSPTGGIVPGRWYHFAAVISSDLNYMKLYVDGVEAASAAYSSAGIRDTSGPLMFGKNITWDTSLHGSLDEIAIYKRALSADEVQTLFNNKVIETISKPELPTVTDSPQITASSVVTLVGTKQADTSLWINGELRVPVGPETGWQADVDLAYGTNTFTLQVRTANGFASDELPVSIVLDNRAPVIESLIPADGTTLNSNTPSISISISDEFSEVDLGASLVEASCLFANDEVVTGEWQEDNAGGITFTPDAPLPEGRYRIVLPLVDSLGNYQPFSSEFGIDQSLPSVSDLEMSPESPHKAEKVEFTVSFDEPMDSEYDPVVMLTKPGTLWDTTYQVTGSPAYPYAFYDPFDGQGSPNSAYWTTSTSVQENPTIEQIDGRLVTSFDYQLYGEMGVISKFKVSGDFDVEVSLEFLSLDEQHPDVGAEIRINGASFWGRMRARNSSLYQMYQKDSAGDTGWGVTAKRLSNHGRLKISRSGKTVSYYYADGDSKAFTLLRSRTAINADEDVVIRLFVGGFNEVENLEVRWDDFKVITGEIVGLDTVPDYGNWIDASTWQGEITFTTDSGDGEYAINVSGSKDLAGNEMFPQEMGSFVLDTDAPEPLEVDPVDSPTRLATQTLTGRKTVDTLLVVNDVLKAVPADALAWSLDVPLQEGDNNFSLLSRDLAGNDSPATLVTIVLDTTPPRFTIDTYDPQSSSATQTVAGTKEPGCTVTLDGNVIIAATDDQETWSHQVTLKHGLLNRLQFEACDVLDNCTSRTLDLSYDSDPPPALAAGVLQADGEGDGSQVFLSWPSYPQPSDLAYYQVYMSTTSPASLAEMTPLGTVDPTRKEYAAGGLTEGQEYYFTVVAYDASGNFIPEAQPVLGVPLDVLPPEEVTGFKALVDYDETAGNQVLLIWQPSVDSRQDLTELVLYTDSGSGYGDGLPLDAELDRYLVTGLDDATLYKFRLTTRDDQGYESSGVVTQTVTRLANPAELVAEVGKNQVSLSWQPVSSPYLKSYRIYRLQSATIQSSSTAMTLTKEVTGTSATLTGLTNDVPYQFAVTTVNSYGAENTTVETIIAQPRQDAEGPVISLPGLVNGQVLLESLTIQVTAADTESNIGNISIFLDEQLVKSYVPTQPVQSDSADYYWNLVQTTDGPHTLWVTASDELGNLTQKQLELSVQQRPPKTPDNLQHLVSSTTPEYLVTFSGKAEPDTTVALRLNGVNYPETVATSGGAFSFSGIPLVEGLNKLAVRASHRGGDSPWSSDYSIVADTGAPGAPTALSANLAAGGVVQLSWVPSAGEAPSGYHLYRSDSAFSAQTDAGVTRLTSSKLLYTFKELVVADELEHYYAVSAVDAAGNESQLSQLVAIAADRSAPQVTELVFNHSDGASGVSFVSGPGTLDFVFSVSEPLAEVPFFSLEPVEGAPIIPALTQLDALNYSGSLRIDATSPHGTLTWKYSGKDALGNRATESGGAPILDVQGPQASIVEPLELQQLSGAVTVRVVFDEACTITPQFDFVDADGSVIPVTALVQDGDARNWLGSIDLSTAAEGVGAFRLNESRDSFDNFGQQVVAGKELLLYADLPPAPAIPLGLDAVARSAGEVDLLWKTVTGAGTYRLYRRLAGATDFELIKDQTATAWRDLPPADGDWEYAVSAVGPLGSESDLSAAVSVRSDRSAPDAPQGLELAIGGDGVTATWQAVTPDTGESIRYRLYRAGWPISDLSDLTAVVESELPEALDGAANPSLRNYAVTALDSVGNESLPSLSVSIDFPVAPVKNLLVQQIETALPAISWEAPQNGIVGYTIYRNGRQVNAEPTPGTSFTDVYYNGRSVRYGIEAIDSFGNRSPVREALLPQLELGIAEGTILRRGLLETVPLNLQSEQEVTLSELRFKLGSAPQSILAGPIALAAGSTQSVSKVAAAPLDAGSLVAAACTAVIKPASGTTVEIVRTSQAEVVGASAALEIFNEPLIRGTEASVQLKLNNLGSAAMELLTSENGGATNQVMVRLLDQDGNLLAQGRLNQRIGSQVINSSGHARAVIEPDTSFLSEPITFRVPDNAPYAVVLEAVVANTYHRYGQPEQVTAPGMRQAVASTIAEVSYTARAEVAKDLYHQGEEVLISGQTLATGDGSPMAYVPVRLGISSNGYDRYFDLVSDEAGTFSYTYRPASNEAGSYSVWAVHPDLSDRSVQDRFDIIAMTLSPARYDLKLAKGAAFEIPITLTNYSGRALTELDFALTASSGLTATLQNADLPANQVLDGYEKQRMKLRVTSENSAHSVGYVTLQVASAEGLTQKLDVNVTLVELIPVIRTSPSFIEAGMVRDSQKLVKFTLKNDGQASLNNARIEGPSTAWMSLLVDPQIGSLAVGQSVEVGLLLQPDQSVPAGVYHDRLVIYSDNHIPYTYNLTVTVSSDAVGNVAFNLLNELLEDVVGATINLQHQQFPDLYYTVKTDSPAEGEAAGGSALINDIPEGRYSFNVSATGHKPYSGSFVVSPGVTTVVPVAMQVTLVEFEWSVTEITIEDRYEITINQTFETNVPTSVIVVEPPGVNLPAMEPGGVYNGEFTITNYGLIRADFKGLKYPSSFDDYEMEVLGNIPVALEAYEKIVVPYRITRKSAAPQE